MADKQPPEAGPVRKSREEAEVSNRAAESSQEEAGKVEVGMVVTADKGDLGKRDISEARVSEVVHDETGRVEKVVAEKGTVFRKKIDIPVGRIRKVKESPEAGESGKVVIKATKKEVDDLGAVGREALPPRGQPREREEEDLLDAVGEVLPTQTGLRRMEQETDSGTDGKEGAQTSPEALEPSPAPPPDEGGAVPHAEETRSNVKPGAGKVNPFKVLGPGLLSGMAGNDASAVAAYSLDGASNGFGHLWLMLLATPLLQAVQFACAKIGRVQQKGLADILREQYGRKLALPATLIVLVANVALIAADLVAISTGLQLITGWHWAWFTAPVALGIWYVAVFRSFESIEKIFLLLSMIFTTYIATAFFCRPDWGEVLTRTVVPQVHLDFGSVSTAVAILGATISPYTIFWQVQGEKESKRFGTIRLKFRMAALDIAAGVISGNLVAYFIIVSTAATVFRHREHILTAVDAAAALEPLVGSFAKYLFALGLIGAGVIAIPVLLASASYGVAGTIGWPAGLSKKPWQNEGFYLILTLALAVGLLLALVGIDPVHLMFWANVLQGTLTPFLVVLLAVMGNSGKIMGENRLGLWTNAGLALGAAVMFGAAGLLVYGLCTGG